MDVRVGLKKAEHRRINAFEPWCWRRLLSPLDCKEIQPVHLKGNQSWIFIGKTDAAAEAPILWPLDVKNWLIGKDPDAAKDLWHKKWMTENVIVGWHHLLNGHEFEQAPGVGDEAWCVAIHGVTKSRTWLNNWTDCINIIALPLSYMILLIYFFI